MHEFKVTKAYTGKFCNIPLTVYIQTKDVDRRDAYVQWSRFFLGMVADLFQTFMRKIRHIANVDAFHLILTQSVKKTYLAKIDISPRESAGGQIVELYIDSELRKYSDNVLRETMAHELGHILQQLKDRELLFCFSSTELFRSLIYNVTNDDFLYSQGFRLESLYKELIARKALELARSIRGALKRGVYESLTNIPPEEELPYRYFICHYGYLRKRGGKQIKIAMNELDTLTKTLHSRDQFARTTKNFDAWLNSIPEPNGRVYVPRYSPEIDNFYQTYVGLVTSLAIEFQSKFSAPLQH